MGTPILTAKGHNGQIELWADKIIIRRQGLLAFMTQGLKGDKEILTKQISSVQFKPAGTFFNGYIQFGFLGGLEAKGGIMQATQDENTVMFKQSQQTDFEKLKRALDESRSSTTSNSEPSGLNQLERLAKLVEQGFVTQEEFSLKKKQLLG